MPAPLAIPAEHHDTFFMVDQVIEHLADHGGEPWIVHLSLLRPHPPWVAPEPYNALYDPESLPGFVRAESADARGRAAPVARASSSRATTSARRPTSASCAG